METGPGMYREHKGVDIAIQAHEIEKDRWVPRTVLFDRRHARARSLAHPGYASEQEALEAGMRMALEAIDRMHVAPASKEPA